MLVLTRRIGEVLLLSNGVRIVVTDVKPGRVKLGIEAPREVNVMRAELCAETTHSPKSPSKRKPNGRA